MDTGTIVHGRHITRIGHITGQHIQFMYKITITIQQAGIMTGPSIVHINIQTTEEQLRTCIMVPITAQAEIHIKMGIVQSIETGLIIPTGM